MTRYIRETATPQQRADEDALRALSDRYADAVNHRDWDAIADTWAEEGVWDLGAPVSRREEGRSAIMAEVRRAVEGMSMFLQTPHAWTLLEIDGDTARARVTLQEVGVIDPEAGDILGDAEGMTILAVYTDNLRRGSDGRWRFAKRRYDVKLFDPRKPKGVVV